MHMISSKLASKSKEPPQEIMKYKEALSKILEDVENSYEQLKNPHANSFYREESPRVLDALVVALRGTFVKDDLFIPNYYPIDSFLLIGFNLTFVISTIDFGMCLIKDNCSPLNLKYKCCHPIPSIYSPRS